MVIVCVVVAIWFKISNVLARLTRRQAGSKEQAIRELVEVKQQSRGSNSYNSIFIWQQSISKTATAIRDTGYSLSAVSPSFSHRVDSQLYPFIQSIADLAKSAGVRERFDVTHLDKTTTTFNFSQKMADICDSSQTINNYKITIADTTRHTKTIILITK